jgi:hypothetical protein
MQLRMDSVTLRELEFLSAAGCNLDFDYSSRIVRAEIDDKPLVRIVR